MLDWAKNNHITEYCCIEGEGNGQWEWYVQIVGRLYLMLVMDGRLWRVGGGGVGVNWDNGGSGSLKGRQPVSVNDDVWWW